MRCLRREKEDLARRLRSCASEAEPELLAEAEGNGLSASGAFLDRGGSDDGGGGGGDGTAAPMWQRRTEQGALPEASAEGKYM